MKRVTLQDIAKELGITKGTVDRAIHNRPDVSRETRDKVMELVRKYGYTADRAARTLSLRSKKLRIGVILQSTPQFFWDSLKSGIKKGESELFGYKTELIFRELKNPRQAVDIVNIMDEFIHDRVDAVMLVPVNNRSVKEKIDEACDNNIPVITLNDDINDSKRLFYVGPQMQQSGRLAGELMGRFLKGAGKVMVINGSIESLEYQERFKGFSDVLQERFSSINVIASYIYNLNELGNSGDTVLKGILENMQDIDGIYDVDGASLFNVASILKGFRKEKEVVLIGHEIWSGVRELIEDGVIDACISQDPYSQGYFSIKLLYSYIADGQKPQYDKLNTKLDIIVKENVTFQDNVINPYYI